MNAISSVLKLANNKITVALSGGIDSIACAFFLKTKFPKINLTCRHFNHKLRPQNDDMEIMCRKFCHYAQIPFSLGVRDTTIDTTIDTKPSEAALRELRYHSMRELGYVATAHHIGDAVENYLFNCLNGHPEYLPIPLYTVYTQDGYNLNIIRPFILNSKQDFRDYCEKNDLLQFVVEDETNTDTKYRRNWLRNDIIPVVKNKGYNLETIVNKRYQKYIKENF